MNSTNASATRICPVCDAKNSGISLFCAECGASLNLESESTDTSAFEPVSGASRNDSQQTAVFTPASSSKSEGAPIRSTVTPLPEPGRSGANSATSTWSPPVVSPADTSQSWISDTPLAVPVQDSSRPQGIRGFVLGLIAVVLILALFLVWGWASVLSAGTRDSIQDFFSFIG